MVQTFAVFADNLTTAKIKTVKSFNSPVGLLHYAGLCCEIRTAKVSSRASGGIFAKVSTHAEI